MMNKTNKELRRHQWKAFERHPMFNRDITIKVMTGLMLAVVGIQLVWFGFMLDSVLKKGGAYNLPFDSFNYILPYVFLCDFTLKYLWKKSHSIQIAPYLTLPIKRRQLFNFLLVKEFYNAWNLFPLLLLVPFAFKAILPHYGILHTLIYILFFYTLCIMDSLLVNIANNLLHRRSWFYFLPFILVAAIGTMVSLPGWETGDRMVRIGQLALSLNPFVWGSALLAAALLWRINHGMLRSGLYRDLEGQKVSGGSLSLRLPFIGRLGKAGMFINLEVRMLLRSKRMKRQLFSALCFVFIYIMYFYNPVPHPYLFKLFFSIYGIGFVGVAITQFLFTTESAYFDGLMARDASLFDMLKGKYIFYVSFSTLVLSLAMIPAFQGKVGFLFLFSTYFYAIGFLYFLMFQNAVYNKTYMDLAHNPAFDMRGQSSSMFIIGVIGMVGAILLVMAVKAIFNETIANYYMLATGLAFTLLANRWLGWTYRRFRKRRHINMEGFRSN